MRLLFAGAFASALLLAAANADAACYDLSKGEPRSLTGVLSHRMFVGSPGFEDVRKGDMPEAAYVLRLPAPICLGGDEFADPGKMFSEAQLVETEKTANAMRLLLGKDVTVALSRPMPAMTGHHHRPLVAWVTEIVAAEDPTVEYGTAATTVRGFYAALASGDGGEAANFIVPEKRVGPFSPDQMSRFYGALASPLALLAIEPDGPDAYLVRYRFTSGAGRNRGRFPGKRVRGGLVG